MSYVIFTQVLHLIDLQIPRKVNLSITRLLYLLQIFQNEILFSLKNCRFLLSKIIDLCFVNRFNSFNLVSQQSGLLFLQFRRNSKTQILTCSTNQLPSRTKLFFPYLCTYIKEFANLHSPCSTQAQMCTLTVTGQ